MKPISFLFCLLSGGGCLLPPNSTKASADSPTSNSFVTVGDAGNAADTRVGADDPSRRYGAVGYEFQIQKFEFTNVEYVDFLNSVGGTNPNGIYSSSMGSDVRGGITQSGASPNFTYAVKANMGDKPVNYVSWFEAARVANWLHNGRSNDPALLERGAYTLNNGMGGVGYNKNEGATYWIPSEDEWYKAAYYKGGGVSAGYWLYPRFTPLQTDKSPMFTRVKGHFSISSSWLQGPFWRGTSKWQIELGRLG